MQNFEIYTDESGRELIEHGNSLFPIAGYDEYFSEFVLNEVSWHWHDEIELVVVIDGCTKVEYVDGHCILEKGDGIFINSNILHRLTQVGDIDCHIVNFVLKPEFIGGRFDSVVYTHFVEPITSNQSISAIKVTPSILWEKDFITYVLNAFWTFEEAPFGYELLVRSDLTKAWHLLCSNRKDLLATPTTDSENKQRMDKIIKHIHLHYGGKLTVKDLANVAKISESECFRMFKRTLNITPNEYILKHRLQLAARKLVSTDESIINLTYNLGFGSPSYFSKKFKAHYACTPREFRQMHLTKK